MSESKNPIDRQEGSPSKIQRVEIDNHNSDSEITPEINDVVEPQTVLCPICQIKLNALDNSSVNEHIDNCLNMPLVQHEMKNQSHHNQRVASTDKAGLQSSKSLKDYFASGNISSIPK